MWRLEKQKIEVLGWVLIVNIVQFHLTGEFGYCNRLQVSRHHVFPRDGGDDGIVTKGR